MYYRPGEHQKAYDEVRTAALISAGECTIAIFCAIDTDSLAACRILCRLLEGDRLPHKLVPVSGFDDLTRENDRLSANSHLRSVIMINCGGTSVLQELMTLSDHVRVYVVDAHRPLCLDNLFDSLQVILLLFYYYLILLIPCRLWCWTRESLMRWWRSGVHMRPS